MNKDYYKTLGVERNATQDEIKKAFRRLAHEHHPDKKGGDDKKFKEISEAYNTLGDAEKRAQYDRFGSGFSGASGAGAGGGFNPQDFGFDFNGQNIEFDLNDILGQFFGGGRSRVRRGKNIRVDIEITFKESIFGTTKEISINGQKMTLSIPTGVENETTLRVAGKGESLQGGQPGDLLVTLRVIADRRFRKEGQHIVTDLSIPVSMALLGAEIKIETLDGQITLKIPEGISNAELLRVKGRGVPDERGRRGDFYVRVLVVMPKKISREARKLIEALKKEGI